jgi:predicted ATPase
MGLILSRLATSGLNIVVETHSDHLVNGVRLAVVERTLSTASVAVYFFSGAFGEGHGITRPLLDHHGRFDVWPKGFFDQAEEDLSQLAGWT